jgi:High potential iron-sulfur protein
MLSHRDARRAFLKNAGVKLAAVAPLAMSSRAARASKANKSDFFYQEKPKQGKRCADCRLFNNDGSRPGLGTCTVVEGVISAEGWCMAYTPR